VPASGDGFFFLEMNTRLQVEHPVTELVYGVDLVEQQLRMAFGEPLALGDLRPAGHAIEARLYAEDPAAGFLPSTGVVRRWRPPPHVRVDAGIRTGTDVGTDYDPLLAKVVAHAGDRPTALRRLDRALAELELLGVATNAAFTRALLARDDVRAGELDTGLLERVLAEPIAPPPPDLLAAAAVARFLADTAGLSTPPGPWRRLLEGHGEVRVRGDEVVAAGRSWRWAASGDGAGGGSLRLVLDGVSRRYAIAHDRDVVWVGRDGHQLEARAERALRSATGAAAGSLEAPMPGTVLAVHVADGDRVAEGDVLLVLESMKMELPIAAPHVGTVAGLTLAPGDRVALRQPLVAVLADEDPP
jgi:acetyl-CoA/propionyl-CoA carboxylase biotin carboxyl carrier protein